MTGTSTRAHHRSARRGFWTAYQPGFRVSDAPLASPEFFAEVEADRYSLEPAIEELARFESWANRDVLEAGCGIASDGMRFVRAGARYTGLDFSPVDFMESAMTELRDKIIGKGEFALLSR